MFDQNFIVDVVLVKIGLQQLISQFSSLYCQCSINVLGIFNIVTVQSVPVASLY